MSGSAIRLISIDLDDTLWPAKPVLQKAEVVFYRHLQRHAPALTERLDPEALRAERLAYLQSRPELAHYISRWRRESLEYSLVQSGYGSESRALADRAFAVFWRARQQVTLFSGAAEALASLSQRYTIISLTNGNADLCGMPASRFVKYSLRAEEVGAAKPDPTLFKQALALANCAPEQAVHIGDHPIDDITAAAALGIRGIQARLLNESRERHQGAAAELEHWRDAPAIIERLASTGAADGN